MSHHHEWDLVFVAVFSLGQLLFMLKRADLAKRSPLNGIKTIRAFFSYNWVTLLFRAVLEQGLVLWPYREASGSSIQWLASKMGITIPFQIPQHRGLVGAFFIGIGADFLLDWVLMQKWVDGIPFLGKLKEQIPQLPEVKQFVNTLAEQKDDSDDKKEKP